MLTLETCPQVIRGPGTATTVDKETVREYVRTPSDVAAGRAPAHETITETEMIAGPTSSGAIADPLPTDVLHDGQPMTSIPPPMSVVPPSTVGSQKRVPVSSVPPTGEFHLY